MTRRKFVSIFILLCITFSTVSCFAAGRDVTVDALKARREAIEASESADLDKDKILKIYDAAIAQAKLTDQINKEIAQLKETDESAGNERKKLTEQLKNLKASPAKTDIDNAKGMRLDEINDKITALKIESDKALRDEADIAAEIKRREDIIQSAATRKSQLKSSLDDVQKQLTDSQSGNGDATIKEANRLLYLTQQANFNAKLELLAAELASYQSGESNIKTKHELAQLKAQRTQAKLDAWKNLSNKIESQSARKAADQTKADLRELDLTTKIPQMQQLASQTKEMANEFEGQNNIFQLNAKAEKQLAEIKSRLAWVTQNYKITQKKVESIGLTEPVGILLRKKLKMLPVVEHLKSQAASQAYELDDLQIKHMEYQEQLESLANIDSYVSNFIAEINSEISNDEKAKVQKELKQLCEAQKNLLEKLNPVYQEYIRNLENIQISTADLVGQTDDFRDYIEERILWIKSNEPLMGKDLKYAADGIEWILSPSNWMASGKGLMGRIAAAPVVSSIMALIFAGVLIFRRNLKKKLWDINLAVEENVFSPFYKTLAAILITAILSIIFPAIIWFIGQMLISSASELNFTTALGHTLQTIALIWWPAGFLAMICYSKGIGPTHFRWPESACVAVSRMVHIIMPPGLALIFLATLANAPVDPVSKDSLSRIITIIGLLGLCVVDVILFRPKGVLISDTIGRKKRGWLYSLRYPIVLAAAAVPLILAVAVFIGYFETAIVFASKLVIQLWLILMALVANSSILRWLMLGRRRLVSIRRQKQLEQQRLEQESGESGEHENRVEISDEEMNISEVHAQTRQIVRYSMAIVIIIGMQMIWSGTFPALRLMSKIPLWSIGSGPDEFTVSLGHLVAAILVLVVALIINKNITGMMEVILQSRFKFDQGERYAITTISRYLILTVGIVITLQTIGITWKSIQWLIAAMSLGVGFGLQEIIANFVSGLIILFERPIRLGDVVTIGDVSGKVTKIRIRATTITDWDRKELVVPNKEFVTGKLINWTLSDNILRICIPVGIAYGSNTDLAKELLMKVAKDCHYVLEEPQAYPIFHSFGDSTLNFELRAFVNDVENLIMIKDSLTTAIDKIFRENNIEIAFPQCDLHIRSAEAVIPISRNGKE